MPAMTPPKTIAETDAAYDALIASAEWGEAMEDLNLFLQRALEWAGKRVAVNGNLFYGHLKPDWPDGPYMPEFDEKRRNFVALARHSTSLLEIGVNGGHSLLLALMANPDLQVTGIDVCERLGRDWAHVEVYVPAAFTWLQYHFPDRVRFIKGHSTIEVPRLVIEEPSLRFDMYHLDGSKFTHLQEVVAAYPILAPAALIVHDDHNLRPVRQSDRRLRKIGLTGIVDLEPMGLRETVWQGVRRKAS